MTAVGTTHSYFVCDRVGDEGCVKCSIHSDVHTGSCGSADQQCNVLLAGDQAVCCRPATDIEIASARLRGLI